MATTDEQAIDNILKQLETAWNAGDSANFVAPFAEDANFIHIYGGQMDGRAAIEAAHRMIFDTIYKGSRNRLTLRSIRFVRPDVAVVFVAAHLDYFEGGLPRAMDALPTLIAAKE